MLLRRFIKTPNTFWLSVATMVGSIVGIGLFGIPFVFQKSGFGIGMIFLLVLGGISVLTNLFYGEIILRTHERHQFVGYVHTYRGRIARWINLFNFWVAVFGSTTATLIINGEFLSTALRIMGIAISPFWASTIFVIVAAIVVYSGLKTVSKLDFLMMVLFFATVLLIGGVGAPHLQLVNFEFVADPVFWFLPFGVILFALQGIQGVPLVREVLVGKERLLKKAIVFGTVIPVALYAIFTFIVVGISGEFTSPDTIEGLTGFLGTPVILIGSLFGFLTSSTIFLSTSTAFKESLWQDFKFKKTVGFLIVMIPAYLLFALGTLNFINIMGLVGGVAVGIDLILLIFVYAKAKHGGSRIPEYSIRVPNWVLYCMMTLFALGAFYTLFAGWLHTHIL